MDMSISKNFLLQLHPETDAVKASTLAKIWDQAIHLIIEGMLDLSNPIITELHINLREEMILELAKLQLFLGNKVVEDRVAKRMPNDINVDNEREACLGDIGLEKINNTAKILYEHVWLRKYNERWKPKTISSLKKEESPRKVVLKVEPKENNHFIPKSFIKRYWSKNGKIQRYKFNSQGILEFRSLSFGQWGFIKNLYSDYLEAYFGLIEGDAVQPISMLLNVEPLNRPQKEALICFIVIQRLRNPLFIETLIEKIKPVVEEHVGQDKSTDNEYMRKAYETLYANNDFYDQLARPVMKNDWVVVRSEQSNFILPDTCNIFGNYDGGQYVIAPITPNDCLVVLPYEDREEKIISNYIKGTEKLIQDMCSLLLLNVNSEFLAGPSFSKPEITEEKPNEIMQRIILSIAKIDADKYRSAVEVAIEKDEKTAIQ